MTQVLVPLANGFEDLEAVTVIDLLRRANINVITAGLAAGPVRGSRGTIIVPDATLDDALKNQYTMVVLPGGQPGATHLENDERIKNLITKMSTEKSYIAAVCAAPKVLAATGILDGKNVTCYPDTLDNSQFPNIKINDAAVVVDGNVITSRGPGTAMDFALKLIELISGQTKRDEVEKGLVR